jgi:hypothetical protein
MGYGGYITQPSANPVLAPSFGTPHTATAFTYDT